LYFPERILDLPPVPLTARQTERRAQPDAEVSWVRGELTSGEWTLGDARHRGFVLESGGGRVSLPDGEFPVTSPCLIWLPADAQARLLLNAGSRGISLAVNEVRLAGESSRSASASCMNRVWISESGERPVVRRRVALRRSGVTPISWA
jgi:hypothetical protein